VGSLNFPRSTNERTAPAQARRANHEAIESVLDLEHFQGPWRARAIDLSERAVSDDDARYRVMRLLEANPEMSQRQVARELGMSLGKINRCVQDLIRKGWIKAQGIRNHRNRVAYLITRRGLREKADLTIRFLHVKMREHERLRAEIEQMQEETQRR
jgi:EPS-associated MarR family transcriptional regulator